MILVFRRWNKAIDALFKGPNLDCAVRHRRQRKWRPVVALLHPSPLSLDKVAPRATPWLAISPRIYFVTISTLARFIRASCTRTRAGRRCFVTRPPTDKNQTNFRVFFFDGGFTANIAALILRGRLFVAVFKNAPKKKKKGR